MTSKKATVRDVIRRLRPFLLQSPWLLVSALLAVLMYAAMGRAIPNLFGAVVEQLRQENLKILPWLAVAYLAVVILRGVFTFAQSYGIQKLGNRVLFGLREQTMIHCLNLPVPYFNKNPIGRIVTRTTNDLKSVGELFNQGLMTIFINLIEVVTILTALFLISVPLTMITVILLPFLLWLTHGVSQKLRREFSISKKIISKLNSFTAESLNGMTVLQLFNKVPHRYSQFSKISGQYKKSQVRTVDLFARLWPILGIFNISSVTLSLFVGGVYHQQLGINMGQLTAFMLLVQSFFRPIRMILERYNQFQDSLASADRVFRILDEPRENSPSKIPATIKDNFEGGIEFKDLWFRYDTNRDYVLKAIQLKIPKGTSVALVGRTGSGKSTMIALLQKFYAIQKGSLLVDGVSIEDLPNSFLRSHIGVVQQDPVIFRGTLLSNVTLDNPNISEETARQALKEAYCENLIQDSEEGLHRPIEEKGANLSTGEKQLISFARVLAHNPKVLILDEATSNIDSFNEKLIQESLLKITKDRTSLIIAHRLSTIRHCDQIVLLDQGQILEVGSHDELIQKKGKYLELLENQHANVVGDILEYGEINNEV